jgi:rhodanese-related sulfurtransferase
MFGFKKNKSIDERVEELRTDPNIILLDVREKDEYKEGHIPKSRNIPLSQISDALKINRNQKLYVYCRSGNRSQKAVNFLKENGFTDVTNIGGIMSYHGRTE